MTIETHDALARRQIVLRPLTTAALVAALAFGASACGAQDQPGAPKSKAAPELRGDTGVADKSSGQLLQKRDTDAAAGAPDKEKEKRGNTPPGTTRAGDPPAAGAIVDPAGVTKK